MFSSSQKNLFYFWSLMTNLYSYKCQDYNTFMVKIYPSYVVYYVQHLYIYIVKKMSKLYPLRTKNKTKNL